MRTKGHPITDRQRFDAVFAGLAAAGVAYLFDMRGTTGVRDWDYQHYMAAATQAGTTSWVGTHVGSDEFGGGRWDSNGVLCAGPYLADEPVTELYWSFNHQMPELADLLVRLFAEQGIEASWRPGECVIVELANGRGPIGGGR